MRTSICCAWRVEMWLAPGWTSSAFAICTQCHPQLGPAGVLHGRAPHGVERRSKATSIYSGSSTSRRNSRANDELLAQTARSIGIRFQSHTADTAAPLVGTTSGALQRPGPGSSLTLAILESAVGDFSPRQLRDIADSPAYRDLEIRLLGNGDVRASRAEASLRELLEAITSVVGEGDGSRVAKVVTECPALLLCEGRELLATVQELRAMEGVTEEKAMRLVVELPSFFTLPPAARERVGLFLGEVGLTAKEVGRLAKRHPDVIEKDAGGHARRIVDIFLQDLQVGKAAFRRMVRRQPGLLSLSVTGNVLEKIEFFTQEMGLRNDQIAKMVCAHPQIIFLSLENSIRPIVKWLGSPDPEARLKGRSLGIAGAEAETLSSNSPPSSKEETDTLKDALVKEYASGLDEAGATPECSEGAGGGLREMAAVGVDREAVVALIEMPAYTDGEWDWGLGLDREGRSQVVSKQGDVLWKSVPGNLAKSTAWFVQEVGLGWDDMRKLATRAPTLLSLSVENNLEPTLAFLVKELGMDPANLRQTVNNQPSLLSLSVASNLRPKAAFFRDELGANERDIAELLNQCPRVMNASVQGRILPRVQVMRAAGVSPTFRHLRAICTYPDVRFAPWVTKLAGFSRPAASSGSSCSSSGPVTTATAPRANAVPSFDFDSGAVVATTAVIVPQDLAPRRGRRLRGEPPRPSVRTNSLAELGISYTVSPWQSGAVAALSAAAEEREAFAPGRAGGKAVVRRVSHGLEVLDLYCGTGGFAMNAAVGKARSALGVDKDARAVRTAKKNASANGLGDTVSFVRAGVLRFAEKAANEGRAWDLVVLDLPCSPSKSAKSRSRAANTYTRLAESSSRLVRSGGMLMAVHDSTNDIFETPEKMAETFSSAAARTAGISLTLIDAAATAAAGDGNSATGSGGNADGERDAGVSRSVPLPMSKRHVSGGRTAEEGALLEDGGLHPNDVGVDAAGNRGYAVEDSPLWWALFVCSKAPLDES